MLKGTECLQTLLLKICWDNFQNGQDPKRIPACLYNRELMSFVGKEFILSLGFYVKAKRKKKLENQNLQERKVKFVSKIP